MRYGYFGIVTIFTMALAAVTQINQRPYLAGLAIVAMMIAQGLALWGYEKRSELHLLSGIFIGMLFLPAMLTSLALGPVVSSILLLPTALIQLDLGIKRLHT